MSVVWLAALAACVVLAGCGSSSGSTGKKHKQKVGPAVTMNVSVPGLPRSGALRRSHTCDGRNISLPVRWSGVPAGTEELLVFIANLRPTHGRMFFDWAVAGLPATTKGLLAAGKLPAGAIVGRNGFGKVGYSICPPKSAGRERFVVRVEALAHPLHPQQGFDPETLFHEAERKSTAAGYTPVSYKRS